MTNIEVRNSAKYVKDAHIEDQTPSYDSLDKAIDVISDAQAMAEAAKSVQNEVQAVVVSLQQVRS